MSNTCDHISLCEHKSAQMLQAVIKHSLTWMPETFDARFPVAILYSERCAKKLFSAL